MSARAPAVARLVLTYFTRTPGLRWVSYAGLASFAVSCALSRHMASNWFLPILAFASPFIIFLGAGIMPSMVVRMARSHAICVLPYGRLKLFLSAVVTVSLVSLPAPVLSALALMATIPPDKLAAMSAAMIVSAAFYGALQFYPIVLLIASWLYFTLWFISNIRGLGGLIGAMLGLMASIYAPSVRIANLDPSPVLTLVEVAITWAIFALLLFYLPRLRANGGFTGLWPALRFPGRVSGGGTSGRELEILLGTARPGVIVGGICVPYAVLFYIGLPLPKFWLFYLTLASCLCGGAFACRAALRARALWLRTRWTRDELFMQVERTFFKLNGILIAWLVALLIGFSRYYEIEWRFVVIGAPVIVLSAAVSTCLGLMMTRGMRWLESILTIVVMGGLMAVAVLVIFREHLLPQIVAVEIAFAIVAVALRIEARRRWRGLDWALCRPEIGAESRAFS